jgi:hypothetical protein
MWAVFASGPDLEHVLELSRIGNGTDRGIGVFGITDCVVAASLLCHAPHSRDVEGPVPEKRISLLRTCGPARVSIRSRYTRGAGCLRFEHGNACCWPHHCALAFLPNLFRVLIFPQTHEPRVTQMKTWASYRTSFSVA